MKKIFYILVGIVILASFGLLVFSRLHDKKIERPIISKVIVPAAAVQKDVRGNNDSLLANAEGMDDTLLESGELFLASVEVDFNLDGFADKLVAILRTNENAIYLVPSLQDAIQKNYIRGEAIKLETIQTVNFSLYTLDLGVDEKSAIVCSGISQGNAQALAIFLPEDLNNNKGKTIGLKQIAFFQADLQIRINKDERANTSDLSSYTVSCFDPDPAMPNSLTQIEKIYAWSPTGNVFEKVDQKIIPGEKVESEMLKKIGNGNVKLFRDFLNGLWVQDSEPVEKLFYFDNDSNELIFTDGELQEVYVISSFSQRRYGLYLTTYNKSLTNIILRVDLEIKSLSEVKIHVTEQVTRLKIGAESLWDGVYKKKNDSVRNEVNTVMPSSGEKILRQENIIWKNEKYRLQLKDDSFTFHTPSGLRVGSYTITEMNGKTILQLRSDLERKFYIVTNTKTSLILSEVEIKIDTVKDLGNEKIILYAEALADDN